MTETHMVKIFLEIAAYSVFKQGGHIMRIKG